MAAADDACAYQSECRPGGPYGALRKSHQSEGLPGGRYGALETTLKIDRNGNNDVRTVA